MTRIELENRVWLLANHEEKKRIAGSWEGVCSCLIMTEI
ncbi:Uncharacterised protein [Streptococcus pneumoniae]|nr:Uncharacterised protein [Streptococcus pneumoniae]SNP41425.1 Uncharacterised protein [Streptococcus pneumoniae]